MRFIVAVALLAACQAAYGQAPSPAKVQMVSAFNNFFGSIVGVQNALLAPLAPFGRKLSQATFVDAVGNTQTNPLLRSQVVKGNALGSIFYGVGFSTPGVVAEAITGNDGTGAGRRLLQTGDPYHLTAKANVVSSLLKGYNPNLSPLFQQPTFSPPLYDSFTLQPVGRRLLQDNVAANYLGTAVVAGVNVLDILKGRKLQQLYPGRTGVYQTGAIATQDNAIGSIVDKSASLNDPINDRKALLGFNQENTRHLLDLTTKTNADASILSGNIGYDTVQKSIFGYNQNNN